MVNLEDIKLPPNNFEAEKGVLSCIMLDSEVMYILDGLTIDFIDFYSKEHQIIYKGIKDLWSSRRTIDVITLSDALKKMGELDNIGGIDYLYELSTFVITPSIAGEYAKIVKEKSVLRNILKTAQQIIGEVYDEKDINDILDSVEKKIFNLTQVNLSDSMKHIKDILGGRIEEYIEIVEDPSKLENNKSLSGYVDLDALLGGFKNGELIILAARPSMGKTSFALNLALNAAIRYKKSVAIFSLEMGSEQIVDRILSLASEIPLHKFYKGLLTEEDFANVGEAMEKISDTSIYIDDKGGSTLGELRSKLRRLKIEKGALDLVLIDYLQLMKGGSGSGSMGNRVQEISEISRGLKELARDLQVPIIALSQLSRAVESRPDKRPQLSDLRESGAIEQDADMVMMLYREDYYDPDTDKKGLADVGVKKNRNGPTGDIELIFKKEVMKFFNKANESQDR